MSTTARHARMLDATTQVDPFAPNLQRYWNEPAFRAEIDAEIEANRARVHAAIDEGIRKNRAKLEQSSC